MRGYDACVTIQIPGPNFSLQNICMRHLNCVEFREADGWCFKLC
uniref:Uncharacterized protein n=1 Tax=Arundo donax TaxID=35708 RepID=A0A0A9FBE8_ARUDO